MAGVIFKKRHRTKKLILKICQNISENKITPKQITSVIQRQPKRKMRCLVMAYQKMFSKETMERILSCLDDDFYDIIDGTATEFLLMASFKGYHITGDMERGAKYAAIKNSLPMIFLKADVESREVNPYTADEAIGRIYARYVIDKFVRIGHARYENGKVKATDKDRELIRAIQHGEMTLDEAKKKARSSK